MQQINQVYKSLKSSYRVLWHDNRQVIWIDIKSTKALPEIISHQQVEAMLVDEEIKAIDDPYLDDVITLPEQESSEYIKREKAWEIIKNIVDNPEIFDPKKRGKIIKEVTETKKASKQTVYRYLRRYWQRGQIKNALLPDYKFSGAAGKKRNRKDLKLGRPREIQSGIGSNITVDDERLFKLVIDTIYLKKKEKTFAGSYRKFIDLANFNNPDKALYDLPSFDQFRYFFEREYKKPDVIKKKEYSIIYQKDIKALNSTSTYDALGPGSRYQIDATIADVYLISERDKTKIVGRPVIYFIIDVFSRMVTGLYVGYEGPSWVSAMMALAHTVEDKVAYCKKFGIEIEPDDWPTQGLPNAILADRGEMLGKNIEILSAAFGVRIENTPPYRGDAKGIVERYFRTIQEDFKPYVDGVVLKESTKKRGGYDYRLDAKLSLYDFTEIIIESVIVHNNQLLLETYDRELEMPADLPLIPIYLWKWGVANRTGKLNQFPEDIVKINLLPHKKATISELGIKLFGCFYTCTEAIKEGWFDRFKGARPEDGVTVAYDPRNADCIYLRPKNNLNQFWICELTDRSRRFRGSSFWDVWSQIKEEKKTNAALKPDSILAHSKLEHKIEKIGNRTSELQPDTSSMSNQSRTNNISENKKAEKEIERKNTAFNIKKR